MWKQKTFGTGIYSYNGRWNSRSASFFETNSFLNWFASESMAITDTPHELPSQGFERQSRAGTVKCNADLCGIGSNYPDGWPHMATHCSQRQCPDHHSLPNCWFVDAGSGNTHVSLDDYYEFYHFIDSSMSCIPCCSHNISRDPKMPSKLNYFFSVFKSSQKNLDKSWDIQFSEISIKDVINCLLRKIYAPGTGPMEDAQILDDQMKYFAYNNVLNKW